MPQSWQPRLDPIRVIEVDDRCPDYGKVRADSHRLPLLRSAELVLEHACLCSVGKARVYQELKDAVATFEAILDAKKAESTVRSSGLAPAG